MTFGSTRSKQWTEAVPGSKAHSFTGRTFSRLHMPGDIATPSVGEIWATHDHAIEPHAHGSDEVLYVLHGAIEVGGQKVCENEVIFLPRGTSYSARVVSDEGAHVLRIELPNGGIQPSPPEYAARVWNGPLTQEGFPSIDAE